MGNIINIIDTHIDGLKVLEPKKFSDRRGIFLKIFSQEIFKNMGFDLSIKEIYYSSSVKNVIRGMHFQIPPHDHVKMVNVSAGRIMDVVVDIRIGSPTFGRYFSTELSEHNGKVLLIEKGLAHGFLSLEANSIVTYMQTSCYVQDSDSGIHYDSFGYDWGIEEPVLSERDQKLIRLNDFASPFYYR